MNTRLKELEILLKEIVEAVPGTNTIINNNESGRKPTVKDDWTTAFGDDRDLESLLGSEPIKRLKLENSKTEQEPEEKEIEKKRVEELERAADELLRDKQRLEEQANALLLDNASLRERIKILRNEIIDSRGAVRVVCRVKPVVGADTEYSLRYSATSVNAESKIFNVDRVFGCEATQKDVYDELSVMVEGVLDGYSACVFAYGQTGSGKTYTMEGTSVEPGVVHRALSTIAARGEELVKEGFKVHYRLKQMEVYNEEVRDLLAKDLPSNEKRTTVTELAGQDISKFYDALESARRRRVVGATQCNVESSRSHSLVVLTVELENAGEARKGELVLVDLAGSERLSDSKAEDGRLRETQHINKSLSALGNVFAAIKRGDSHIPFRDSKLTRIMQEYLTGKARTTMIVNINPRSLNETLSSLRFAVKVSECRLGLVEQNILKQI